ncbi:MBL fold metallo-hydrolase [Cytophaga sp. FL35]|uniref:MBL fold metallo-hydrolase n=1 Tax=Cytophaga sp. FL35 TaxID=1904456 RepID=UPI0016534DC7|nr:MBL fold metallo-hydrolase [Cytophaga sp. FL35]MBC6999953.1 MBL fold metallo-hydrolase [Cytophaga sp. FL35]
MKRRHFIARNCGLLASIPLIDLQPLLLDFMNTEIHKCNIGEFQCTIFKDLMFTYKAKDYFINAPEQELKQALDSSKIDPENIASPYIAMLLQKGNQKILIDSGIGFSQEPIEFKGNSFVLKGRLQQLLDKEHIATNDITDVIITHFHPDHIGGVFSSDGNLLFKNATFHMHQKEWDFWHSSKSDSQPPLFKFFVEKNITPLKKENVQLIAQDYHEICEGVVAVNAEGHTAGQIALIIGDKDERLLYISDAFLHPLHMEKLNWQTSFDFNHEKAKKTRNKLLHLAHTERMKINAFHFNFPGLGFAEKNGANWKWVYHA